MFNAGLKLDVWDFAEFVLKARFAQALEEGKSRYPLFRELRFAVNTNLTKLFDRLAIELDWNTQRIDGETLIFDGDGFFVTGNGSRKSTYSSCLFHIWAENQAVLEAVASDILKHVEPVKLKLLTFSIDWHFVMSRGNLQSVSIEEVADDVLLDVAYPSLPGGVSQFIDRYLKAPETILVLQGPPGSGKTRLIRAILGEISRRNDSPAQAMYTGDNKALEGDEIFVKFITGHDDAFVIEDADHTLQPRAKGNEDLHRFLAIADGVVRAQGRKIIFSTNLANVGDLDDALVRPGRCFAHVLLRDLTVEESERLVKALCDGDDDKVVRATAQLGSLVRRGYSLADIYQAVARA